MESLGILVAERYIDIDLIDKTLDHSLLVHGKIQSNFLDLRVNNPDPFLVNTFNGWRNRSTNELGKTIQNHS
jgi:hypothetical protein